MRARHWLLALVISLGVIHAQAEEPSSIKEAIARLVSENLPPETTEADRTEQIRYPDGYDHAKQEKVIEAFIYLRRQGTAAFPELLDQNIPVEKYSCVRYVNGKGSRRPLTVGDVICRIISENVDAPKYLVGFREGETVPHDLKELRAWLRERGDRSLKELQLESIARMKKQVTIGQYSGGSYAVEMHARLIHLEARLRESAKDAALVVEDGIEIKEYKEPDRSMNIRAGSKEIFLNHSNLQVLRPKPLTSEMK